MKSLNLVGIQSILAAIIATPSPLVHAGPGQGVGNGGDVIVCYDRKLKIENGKPAVPVGAKILPDGVELLDYWDWSQQSNRSIALGGGTAEQRAQFAIQRLKAIDPETAQALAEFIKTKPAFVDRGLLPEIDDSNEILATRENCLKTQVAVQNPRPKFGEARVKIDRALFAALSADHQAGLLLHEAIYGLLVKQVGAKNSDSARYYNFMISTDLSGISREEYAEILDTEDFRPYRTLYLAGGPETLLAKIGLNARDFIWSSRGAWFALSPVFSPGTWHAPSPVKAGIVFMARANIDVRARLYGTMDFSVPANSLVEFLLPDFTVYSVKADRPALPPVRPLSMASDGFSFENGSGNARVQLSTKATGFNLESVLCDGSSCSFSMIQGSNRFDVDASIPEGLEAYYGKAVEFLPYYRQTAAMDYDASVAVVSGKGSVRVRSHSFTFLGKVLVSIPHAYSSGEWGYFGVRCQKPDPALGVCQWTDSKGKTLTLGSSPATVDLRGR